MLVVLAFLGLVMPPAYAADASPTVVSVAVTGNAHIPSDRILSVVSTKVGDPFDPAKVQNDLRAIADLGFFADQAPPIIKQRPDGIAITYRVIENPVVTTIRFDGNRSVTSDTLLALMDTAPGQVFNIKTYQQDVLKINSYYDKIGFGGQLPSHVTDVAITPDGTLTLKIAEGLTVRNIIITGPPTADPVLAPNVIQAALVTKTGSPFSEQQRDKDYDAIKDLYKKYDLESPEIEAGVDPSTIDQKAGTADVRYTINAIRVGAVEITGNTKTHDDVIRRELRLRPGMLLTDAGIRRDYDHLNGLGFFDKVDVEPKPGPDPKRPGLVTLNWQVKEQRTGTATVGAGYSGGLTGTGLTGTVSYQENNINGTGDGGSIQVQRGAQISSANLSISIPYLGHTEKSQKYSLGASIFETAQLNYYPVYYNCAPAGTATSTTYAACPATGDIPVSLIPLDSTNYNLVQGLVSNYHARSDGISATLGRRLGDFYTVTGGATISSVAASADLPAGYYFPNPQEPLSPQLTANPLTGATNGYSASNALGIDAPSLANIDSTRPYALHSITIGLGKDTRDNQLNPRHGDHDSLTDEISSPAIGSDFHYDIYQLDVAKFFPIKARNSVLALHAFGGFSTGAIPTNKLFIFSDQQLRGYTDPFYGTDELLGQAELRVPITADAKFQVVGFVESGATRIRGGTYVNQDYYTGQIISTTNLGTFVFHGDAGVGLRFDVPQLGLRTLRLDFAKGAEGTHTSFGIGQSF
jgi:outer membrane protein insertion porin family